MRWKIKIGLCILILPWICRANGQTHPIALYTAIIGTPEAPTIEGGFINTAETKQTPKKNIDSFLDDHAKTNVPKRFHDEFSNDNRIEQLCITTARDPKFNRVLTRAKQLKLPASVALIPIVESHYQTDAVSPKGATGAWQLMPETANDYGLAKEARQNFTASTEVALQVLTGLHAQFHNWTLAFAAYNAGMRRVKLALQRRPDAQQMDDLDLPFETKQYVHRLKSLYQAMTTVARN